MTGEPEPLLKAAIRNKTWLNFTHVKDIVNQLQLKLDGKGKNKVDFVRALVDHFFSEGEMSDEERASTVAGIVTKGRKQLRETEVAVLEILQSLDPEDQQDSSVQKLSKMAREQLQEKVRFQGAEEERTRIRGKQPPSSETPASGQKRKQAPETDTGKNAPPDRKERKAEETPRGTVRVGITPPTLKSLLPLEGEVDKGISLMRDRDSYGYRANYPYCGLLAFEFVIGLFKLSDPACNSNSPCLPHSGPPPNSRSRSWPTLQCPSEVDALEAVLKWLYIQYNNDHKEAPATLRLDIS